MNSKGTCCQGCGSPLQTEHPDKTGYVPAHVHARGDTVRCRRCYRLEHYGTQQAAKHVEQSVATVAQPPAGSIQKVIRAADATLAVLDIWDFEGSFVVEHLSNVQGPLFVTVNKVDLLPARTPPQEVLDWVKARFAAHNIEVDEVRLISAERGTGVKALRKALEDRLPPKARVALVGVTNVGKSSLLGKWLPKGVAAPTASALPGTTQQTIERPLGPRGPIIIDTPGLVPGHRLSDVLCPQCASILVPKRRLRSKLVQLHDKNAIVFGGLAAVKVNNPQTAVVTLAFTSERVPIHVTRADRAVSLLRDRESTWLSVYCTPCRSRIEHSGWEDAQATVNEGDDLVIPGLGWLSPRKASLTLTVTVPAGSHIVVRPRLVGTKAGRPHP